MKKILSIICVAIAVLSLIACAKEQEEYKEPEPLVIENVPLEETDKFRLAVDARVKEILSGDISVVVYAEGVEALQYIGEVSVISTGSERLSLMIIASDIVRESEWY